MMDDLLNEETSICLALQRKVERGERKTSRTQPASFTMGGKAAD